MSQQTKQAFTPGPWEDVTFLEGDEGQNLIDDVYRVIRGGCGYRAEDGEPGFSVSGCIGTANARLIAAAPGLLEALQEIVSELEQCNGGKGPQLPWSIRTLEIARPAIAKALGGSHD